MPLTAPQRDLLSAYRLLQTDCLSTEPPEEEAAAERKLRHSVPGRPYSNLFKLLERLTGHCETIARGLPLHPVAPSCERATCTGREAALGR